MKKYEEIGISEMLELKSDEYVVIEISLRKGLILSQQINF